MSMEGAKPFKEHSELVATLEQRGMLVADSERAARKISQVGYYRLSGFWYPCREIEFDEKGIAVKLYGKPKRLNQFLPTTDFDEIFKLYTLDKRLRFLLLDGIERIEINLKTVLAHELGKVDELAYQNPAFINPTQLKDYYNKGTIKNSWIEWSNRQRTELSRSKEDAIVWHQKSKRAIPIWVAVEAWSFGTLSKYFELLKQSHQNNIAARLGVSNPILLVRWLQTINILRNRCAHHTRVWNQTHNNPIGLPTGDSEDSLYFANFNLTDDSKKKLYGLIVIIWYLVQKIGPNSDWIQHLIEEIEMFPNLPICYKKAMGIPDVGLSIDSFLS
ncbi:abortive phage infection protein [Shewanella sp. WE21]|nr:abortive phage infection protein [Shewanella sp. WE21]